MPWSVAQCLPLSEAKAMRFLNAQNFSCYLPRCRPSLTERIVALFPRYLFVEIADVWHTINATPGISRLLVTERQNPVVVSEKIIRELRAREDRDGLVVLPKRENFRIGQNVRVVSGQFAGRLAIYDGMSSRQRERVLLELLGMFVSVELPIGNKLEIAGA